MTTTASANDPVTLLDERSRWRVIETVFWLCALLPFWLAPTHLQLASQIAITALFAISLDLILGYAGIVSMGHAAFFGLGAYTAGIISAKLGWGEPISGLLLAGLVAGIAGYLCSLVVCRFRHLALIMITLGIGVMLHEIANTSHWLTGGADGLQGVRTWKFLGIWSLDIYGYVAYSYALIVLFICFLVARRIVQSPFGLALQGIRENTLRMPAIGAPVQSHLRKIYTIAAVMAGIAGGVLAQTTETVSLEVLSFQRSADVLVILILGGTGRLYGGIIGAIIYMLARDQLSGLNPQYWYFWIGLLLIAVVMLMPNGILGWLARFDRGGWRLQLGRLTGSTRGSADGTDRAPGQGRKP